MTIAGLQKMTLLDYPGKVACTVFLQGCNFRCPFCHNSELLGAQGPEPVSREDLMAFLKKRAGLLEAVCITGGEPTLQKELPRLLSDIKALGYAVKLDTNGMQPEVLKSVVEQGLVDYVAMDIKNCPERYPETAGLDRLELSKIEQSITFLLEGNVEYEFRTTVVAQLHNVFGMTAIGQWLQTLSEKKAEKYFIQSFVDRDSVLSRGLCAPNPTDLQDFLKAILPFVHSAKIRGFE